MNNSLVLLIALTLVITSCGTYKRIEYVDREIVKYETKEVHDTLVNDTRDSIYHRIVQLGDTVYETKYIEHVKYKERVVYVKDTIRNDSIIIQVVTEEKVVEKKVVPKWCWYCLALCVIFSIFAGIKVYRWIR